MSISPMNYGVNTTGYSAKAAPKKNPTAPEPAGVQPREEAPTMGDTVELSSKKPADDAVATAEAPAVEPKQGLNLVRIGGAAALGAGLVGVLGSLALPDGEAKGGKVKLKDDVFETASDKITAQGKTHVTDTETDLKYEIKDHENSATIGTITGEKTIDNTKYTYVKGDKPSWTNEHTLLDDSLKDVLGAKDAKATIHVEDSILKLVSADTKLPALEFKYDAKGVLTRTDNLAALITADATRATHLEANIAAVETYLKTNFKPETIATELKDKFKPKELAKLVNMDGATAGGKNILYAVGLTGLGLALGGVAGYFLGGKPKPAPVVTSDAPPVA